jgi:Tfp pilus assembly protein PilN
MTIKVDLLPSEKRGFGLDPVLIVLLIIVVLCVVVFYFISAWFDSDIAKKRDEVKGWDDKITLIKADIPKITKMREDNNRLQTQIEVIKSLSNDPERYANVLYELGTLMPKNMYFTAITVDTNANAVSVQGFAQQTDPTVKPLETIAKFMTDVANHSRYFKDATLSATSSQHASLKEPAAYTFGMDLHYDPTRATKSWTSVQPGSDTGTPGSSPSTAPSTAAPTTTSSGSPDVSSSSSATPDASSSASGSGSPAPSSSDAPGASSSATDASSASPAPSGK